MFDNYTHLPAEGSLAHVMPALGRKHSLPCPKRKLSSGASGRVAAKEKKQLQGFLYSRCLSGSIRPCKTRMT